MPVHEWTTVDAGIFHAFHTTWIAQLNASLNGGLLPADYYALPALHEGDTIVNVLTLHVSAHVSPPRTRRRQTLEPVGLARRRTLAIRHISEHRLVAIIEIVSPAYKDRRQHVADFADKIVSALEAGVHVLMIDLFPPGAHDDHGMHAAVRQRLQRLKEPCEYDLPSRETLTLASYAAGPWVEVYLEHLAARVSLWKCRCFCGPIDM